MDFGVIPKKMALLIKKKDEEKRR